MQCKTQFFLTCASSQDPDEIPIFTPCTASTRLEGIVDDCCIPFCSPTDAVCKDATVNRKIVATVSSLVMIPTDCLSFHTTLSVKQYSVAYERLD